VRIAARPILFALMLGLPALAARPGLAASAEQRNLIIFVADGLRAGSVTAEDAPTMSALRQAGVSFPNSHSLFPTFTTPNASAIATGHYLGDTGDFGNSLYLGYRLFDHGNFARPPASSTAFIENDAVLADLDAHFEGNFIGEPSLLALAREHGFGTAAIGKLGPVAIQDVSQLEPKEGHFSVPQTLIIDDLSGGDTASGASLPLDAQLAAALDRAGLPRSAPPRQQPAGSSQTPGVRAANLAQQQYFIAVATRVVLPLLRSRGAPFVLLYWSRDPDGTQHNQGDSLNVLQPGINGASSRAAVHNADDNLRELLEFVRADAQLAASTDVFVTSDHGFATISRHDIDAAGHATKSSAAHSSYPDVPPGFLPPGFLAMDLARLLQEPLYDSDRTGEDAHGTLSYQRVTSHPVEGNGIIGGSGAVTDNDGKVIVAANGGSDLIYLPRGDVSLARRVAASLIELDYVGALFVDDRFGPIPGALPLSSIALQGSARMPRPALVVSFKSFVLPSREGDAGYLPLQHAVLIADTSLQQGQGMHGGFGRDNTYNFMTATGPDFRQRYVDELPVSNADIAPTLMQLLHLAASGRGTLVGRVLSESLAGAGAEPGPVQRCLAISSPVSDGRSTVLEYQRLEQRVYLDQAQLRRTRSGEVAGCKP
jgi:type I phosphodiesterase/nucleotide pyrophosphatase